MSRSRFRMAALGASVASAACLTLTGAQSASAATALPVPHNAAAALIQGFLAPTTPPPGANDGNCRPSAAHPYPVVLVNGTLENMNDNWQGAAPLLANNGYCVFTFNYGGTSPDAPVQSTGPIEDSAAELASFVTSVPNLTGAAKVDKLVGLSPSNNGTTLDELTTLGTLLGVLVPVNQFLSGPCEACVEQEAGSPFLTALNAGGETVPGVQYTVITT